MTDPKYQHGSSADGWMEQNDTPRTDAARFEALRSSAFRQDCIPLKLGQELERELNASQAEVERLRTENVCLQELIQEFYEWPTEAEVREIMNRYHDLLNK